MTLDDRRLFHILSILMSVQFLKIFLIINLELHELDSEIS